MTTDLLAMMDGDHAARLPLRFFPRRPACRDERRMPPQEMAARFSRVDYIADAHVRRSP